MIATKLAPSYQLIQGDCLDILPTLPVKSVDCVIADAPYNIGIAEWDNIANYVDWCREWLLQCQRVLKDTGSLYFFHNDMPQLSKIINMIETDTKFVFRSFITWEKYQTNKQYFGREVIQGINNSGLRCYFPMSEYIVFYTFGDLTGSQQLGNNYAKVNPVSAYLKAEFERGNVSNREIAKLFPSITGGLTGCVSNWLTGLNLPSKEQYETIRNYLSNSRPNINLLSRKYSALWQEYEALRLQYEQKRYTFNVAEKDVTRTWLFKPAEKAGHETPKPLQLIKRILRYSTNKGDVVLDPFAGSGSTLQACRDLERSCITIEKSTKYCNRIKSNIINQKLLSEVCIS